MSHLKEIAESLHPLETQTLLPFREHTQFSQDDLLVAASTSGSQLRTAVEWLIHKNLMIAHDAGKEESVSLTKRGEEYAGSGLPEIRIIGLLRERSSIPMSELSGALSSDPGTINPLVGALKKEGIVSIGEGGILHLAGGGHTALIEEREKLLHKVQGARKLNMKELSPEEAREVRGGYVKRSPEKGLYRIEEKLLVTYELTGEGREILPFLVSRPSVNQLTPALLKSGDWKNCEFRKYDISLNPPRIIAGKRHPYRQFLDHVRSTLIALGFEEMNGPLVETEFWDMDALFMPQFHSARNIHDVYYIKEPRFAKSIEEPFHTRVAECHQNGGTTGSRGWNYAFDREKTTRLILRSQGTALSARTLARGPRIPGKYFAIARCFRYEQIDVTHGTDFFQIEGIVVDPGINFRKLLGLLQIFAREVACAKVTKFAPAYFPFTEPSVELHAKHPELGWMELGGAGIFRPEVTIPLGVDVPVIAWGLGIDRMAMVSLGIRDIRALFTHDLEFIRHAKVVH
jgi:phenylalanyl-tRNA synthetase alpha chain